MAAVFNVTLCFIFAFTIRGMRVVNYAQRMRRELKRLIYLFKVVSYI